LARQEAESSFHCSLIRVNLWRMAIVYEVEVCAFQEAIQQPHLMPNFIGF
jgi:hypothetical protein